MEIRLSERSRDVFERMMHFFNSRETFSFPVDVEGLCKSIGVKLVQFTGSKMCIYDFLGNSRDNFHQPRGAMELACFIGDNPHIFLNKFMGKRNRRLAIAHGLFHLLSESTENHSDILEGNDIYVSLEEMHARAFASALLQPYPVFERYASCFSFLDLTEIFDVPLTVILARAFLMLDRFAIAAFFFQGEPHGLLVNPLMEDKNACYTSIEFKDMIHRFRGNDSCSVVDLQWNILPAALDREKSKCFLSILSEIARKSLLHKKSFYLSYKRIGCILGYDVYSRHFFIPEDDLYFLYATPFTEEDILSKKKVKIVVILGIEDNQQELARLWKGGDRCLIPPSCLLARKIVSSADPLSILEETKRRPFDLADWFEMLLKIVLKQPGLKVSLHKKR